MRVILDVKGVSKGFGGVQALRDVDLEVRAGEILGIVGPNGSGKTTLFNLISGVYRPDTGRIIFDGVDVTSLPPFRRTVLGIGRTFQIPRPFKRVTVMENVAIGAMFGSSSVGVEEGFRVAEGYLKVFGLWDKRDRDAESLTPVERRLMEVARALAGRPKLLLLDEVMAGMPPGELDGFLSILREVKVREGIAVVAMVEHIMRAVKDLAERVVVLHQGRKLVEGPTREVFMDKRVLEVYLGRT